MAQNTYFSSPFLTKYSPCLEVLDDGHGGLLIGHKPLLETLLIIVRPPTPRGPPAQTPGCADLLAAVEEENTLEVHLKIMS